MKPQLAEAVFDSSGLGSSEDFTVDTDSPMFFLLMQDKIYTDKPLAPIREYLCNALDIHTQTGQTRPFDVYLPNELEPVWCVRDFGTGLTEEGMKIFTKYLFSTKTGDNNQVGGFGLGSKSGFAYTDQFTVVSYVDGVAMTWACFINEQSKPDRRLVSCIPAPHEPNGLEVRLPVLEKDFSTFISKTRQVLKFFPGGSYNIVTGEAVVPYRPTVETDTHYYEDAGYHNRTPARVKMGAVVYPIPASLFNDIGLNSSNFSNIIVKADIGDCDLSPSRESLSLNPATVSFLKGRLESILDTAIGEAQKQLNAAPGLWAATKLRNELVKQPMIPSSTKLFYRGVELATSVEVSEKDAQRNVAIKGKRGGPARYYSTLFINQNNTLLVEKDVEDRVLARITEGQSVLTNLAHSKALKPEYAYLATTAQLKAWGTVAHIKLSQLEPPTRVKVNRSGMRVYKYDASKVVYGRHSWTQMSADNLSDDFYWIPFSGSSYEDARCARLLTLKAFPRVVYGISKTARPLVNDNDDAVNVVDYLVEAFQDYIDDPGFKTRLYNYLVLEKLHAETGIRNFARFHKRISRVYPRLLDNTLTYNQYRELALMRELKFVDFKEPSVDGDPLFKELEVFVNQNPILGAINKRIDLARFDDADVALLKTIVNN